MSSTLKALLYVLFQKCASYCPQQICNFPHISTRAMATLKRRHLYSGSFDIRDPYHVISLAVRLDEATGNRDFLLEPLETSSLLSPGNALHKAFDFLESQTKQSKHNDGASKPLAFKRAMTPIILSGLIQAQQGSHSDDLPTPSELLLFTINMRKQALKRMISKTSTYRFRIWFVIVGLAGVAVGMSISSLQSLLRTVEDLGFFGVVDPLTSCNEMEPNSRRLCDTSDAMTWYLLRGYLQSMVGTDCTTTRCSRDSREAISNYFAQIPGRRSEIDQWGHSPYADHTVLTTNTRRKRLRNNHPHELHWLGDSVVMQLVRQEILARKVGGVLRILDVGCGVGSLLYAMLPGKFDRYGLDYEGITLSPVQTKAANHLIARHKLDFDGQVFFQRDLAALEIPKHQQFDVIVSIENILHVPNDRVLKMTRQLVPDGLVIIVTDVVHTPRGELHVDLREPDEEGMTEQQRHRASLAKDHLTHQEIVGILTENGLTLQVARDLGLEYSMPTLVDDFYRAPSFWKKWGFDHAVWFAKCLRWTEIRVGPNNPTLKRTLQLYRQGIMIKKKNERRRKGHEDGDLVYVMYVATKTKK